MKQILSKQDLKEIFESSGQIVKDITIDGEHEEIIIETATPSITSKNPPIFQRTALTQEEANNRKRRK